MSDEERLARRVADPLRLACAVYRCDRPPACRGAWPDGTPLISCDVHCGHGNEDGWCERVAVVAAGPIRATTWCDAEHAARATVTLVLDRPLLWGLGAFRPRSEIHVCEACRPYMAQRAVERGARVVATRRFP